MSAPPVPLAIITGGLGLGGSERQLALVLTHLDRMLFEPHVIVLNPDQAYFNEMLEEAGVRLWLLPPNARGIVGRLRCIDPILRKIRPKIVHSWIFHDNPYAGLLGRRRRIPVRIGSQRNVYASVEQRLPFHLRWLSLRLVPTMVVNSRMAHDEMVARGFSAENVFLLPNCVEMPDLTRSAEWPSDLLARGITPETPVIGTVGNLRRQKNHLRFVAALGRVLPDFPQAHAIIAGRTVPDEPDILPEIEGQIATTGLQDRVHWLGQRHDVPDLMRAMRVFCLTSEYEGTPNVVIEAMAAGCPVVATRVGGVPDLVDDGETGLLVPAAASDPNNDKLVAALRQMLRRPARAQQMGQAGRRRVAEERDSTAVAQSLAGFYLRLLHGSAPG